MNTEKIEAIKYIKAAAKRVMERDAIGEVLYDWISIGGIFEFETAAQGVKKYSLELGVFIPID